MKVLTVIKASSLALLCGNVFAVTSPVVTNDVGSTITGKSAYAVAPLNDKREHSIMERQFVPIIQGLPGVLEYASQTFAAQLVGAATDLSQLKHLCHHADGLTVRLHQQGYDTKFIKNAVCAAANATLLATNAEIQAQTTEAATKIWTVQAAGSIKFYERAFCNIFSPQLAFGVGLNGTYVVEQICGVAD